MVAGEFEVLGGLNGFVFLDILGGDDFVLEGVDKEEVGDLGKGLDFLEGVEMVHFLPKGGADLLGLAVGAGVMADSGFIDGAAFRENSFLDGGFEFGGILVRDTEEYRFGNVSRFEHGGDVAAHGHGENVFGFARI